MEMTLRPMGSQLPHTAQQAVNADPHQL